MCCSNVQLFTPTPTSSHTLRKCGSVGKTAFSHTTPHISRRCVGVWEADRPNVQLFTHDMEKF